MSARDNGLGDQADILFRSAAECCHQHKRYAGLVERGAPVSEQKAAFKAACLSDDILSRAVAGYGAGKGHGDAHADDAWWHKGNMLWHASREYIRHHATCDRMARGRGDHSPDDLGEMAMEFDLEASALLALRIAVDGYRAVRPGIQ